MIDGKFVKALACRHLLPRKSRIMPFRHIDTGLLRHRKDLDLVYRFLFRGTFIRKWSLFKEIVHKSSIREFALFRLAPVHAPAFSGKWIKDSTPDKRDRGMELVYSCRGWALQDWRTGVFLPKRSQSMPLPSVILLGHLRIRSEEIAERISSIREGRASGSLPDWRSDQGYSLIKNAFRSSVRAAFLPEAEASPAMVLRERSDFYHAIPSNRSPYPGEPARILSTTIAVPHRIFRRSFGITRRIPEDAVFDSPYPGHLQLKPALNSSSKFIQLIATRAITTMEIVKRSGTGVALNLNQECRRPLPVLSLSPQNTVSSLSDESPPMMIRQKPGTYLSFDALAGRDGPAAEMAWAKSATSERQSSAEIRHMANLPSSLEKEEISEEMDRKSSSNPQAININKLSEKVYSIIERKLRIERERRGIYA